MIVSVASRKGGTGKTTIAVNLALSLNDVQLLDCDVEEPDCNIFLGRDLDLAGLLVYPRDFQADLLDQVEKMWRNVKEALT
ncbi:MAG: P-loop NTPase [Thermoplasmata archaeon]|nr:P-loop NTPase [Thermoplasmata archaeon]